MLAEGIYSLAYNADIIINKKSTNERYHILLQGYAALHIMQMSKRHACLHILNESRALERNITLHFF